MAVNSPFVSTLYEEQNKSFERERDENIVTKCRSLGKYRERALLQIQSSTKAGLSEPGVQCPPPSRFWQISSSNLNKVTAYAHYIITYLLTPSDLQTFLRPCSKCGAHLLSVIRLSFTFSCANEDWDMNQGYYKEVRTYFTVMVLVGEFQIRWYKIGASECPKTWWGQTYVVGIIWPPLIGLGLTNLPKMVKTPIHPLPFPYVPAVLW